MCITTQSFRAMSSLIALWWHQLNSAQPRFELRDRGDCAIDVWVITTFQVLIAQSLRKLVGRASNCELEIKLDIFRSVI